MKSNIIAQPKESNIIRKSEALLMARYSLSEIAIKMITIVISLIDKDDEDFKLYTLKVQEFQELMDNNRKIGGSSYKQLKDACDELADKKIEFDEGSNIGFFISRWIASAEYFPGTGEIEIEISQKLKPLLLQLKEGRFLNYELKNILPLRSTYVIRLYELLKHEYNKVSKYKKGISAVIYEIYIDKLREEFKIPNSYQYSSHIKRLIFDKAVVQFAKYTDIKISYAPSRKKSKKVLAVEFTICLNDDIQSHLRDLRSFISFIRKNYINVTLIQAKDKNSNQLMDIACGEDKTLYDKRGKRFDNKRSQEIWESLYKKARENELEIFKIVKK